jgi:hypothetical protein
VDGHPPGNIQDWNDLHRGGAGFTRTRRSILADLAGINGDGAQYMGRRVGPDPRAPDGRRALRLLVGRAWPKICCTGGERD